MVTKGKEILLNVGKRLEFRNSGSSRGEEAGTSLKTGHDPENGKRIGIRQEMTCKQFSSEWDGNLGETHPVPGSPLTDGVLAEESVTPLRLQQHRALCLEKY